MKALGVETTNKILSFKLFEGVTKDRLETLFFGASLKQLKHRELLYRSGEEVTSFCLVVDGAVKILRHSPRGEDVIVHIAISGELIGALLLNQGGNLTYPISAKSMGPSLVLCIPKSTYTKYWLTDLSLQTKINRFLYSRMNNIQDDKTMFSSPLNTRIANLLLRHLAHNEKEPDLTEENSFLSHNLTRQEIADSLGVAVESVIRTMSEWQSDGTIAKKYDRGPEFINIQRLIEKAEG